MTNRSHTNPNGKTASIPTWQFQYVGAVGKKNAEQYIKKGQGSVLRRLVE